MAEFTPETHRSSGGAEGLRGERAEVISLVLAEGFPLLLEGMQQAFATEAGIRVLATCENGDEALRAVRRHHADVLVLDLDIPGDALHILKELTSERGRARVVLFAGTLDESVMLEAVRLGVKGIVLKSMPRSLLVQCVRKVHRGGTWIEKVSMGRAVDQLLRQQASYRDATALLTPREFDVVRMVAEGSPNKEIADKLAISEGTVKAHLHHVYTRLGVKGRLELVLYARDKGLFPPLPSHSNAPDAPRKSHT